MLIGETDTSKIRFNSNRFEIVKENQANLWLNGTGKLEWGDHTINVYKTNVMLNRHSIATSMREAEVHIMFYPDGRVTKGQLQLK